MIKNRKYLRIITSCAVILSLLIVTNADAKRMELKKRLLQERSVDDNSSDDESYLNLKIGGIIGVNSTSLYKNSTGLGWSPHYLVRFDVQFLKFLGAKLDMGYMQQRFAVTDGQISSDFFTSAIYVDYRFYPGSNMMIYLLAGPIFNVRLTSSFTDEILNQDYDFEDWYNRINIGISAGAGFEYSIWGLDFFIEFLGQPIITTATKKIVSNVLILDASSNYSIVGNIGAKIKIPLFNSSNRGKNSRMFLNDKSK